MSKKIESIDLNILISNLKTKLNLSNKEINDLVKEDISIPISIFSSDLGMLESICLYLKDELNFSFKNISNYLKISFCNISQRPITKRFKWIFKCRGCGKKFSKNIKICPICGSTVNNIVSKSKKIK